MGQIGRLGLSLVVAVLFGCVPPAPSISDPNPAGVGFGEELFKLQGRVDYIYGHVLRNQKKLELQVGNLQRTMRDLDRGSELSALRADVVELHDELDAVRTTINATPSNDLSELRTKVSSFERALKKQESLDTKLVRIEETVKKMGQDETTASIRAELTRLQGEIISIQSNVRSLSEKNVLISDKPEKALKRMSSLSKTGTLTTGGVEKQEVRLAKVKPALKGRQESKVLLTIHFPAGSSEIDSQGVRELTALASESVKENTELSVVSFVSEPTPPPEQQRMAALRAGVVYAKLTGAGVKKENLSSTVSASTEGWRNRSVEVRRAK